MADFKNVVQVSVKGREQFDHPFKGRWSELFFGNDHPVVLELGCGKGEYTVALAEKYPENNYIGIDIKGARMFTGAKEALRRGMTNVAFLRTHIDYLQMFFGNGEIAGIWLTFPDPHMKKARHRLTSAFYMEKYSNILRPEGIVHLKTDSGFLYSYTLALVNLNRYKIMAVTEDLYNSGILDETLSIQTFYEKQWIERGLAIRYLAFIPAAAGSVAEPAGPFERDAYRSFGRSARQ